MNDQNSNIAPLRVPTSFMQRRDAASQGIKLKLTAELKQLQTNRDRLLSELYEKKAALDDIDSTIDNLANTISRIDREALLKATPEAGS